ncbi:MAG: ABC transporter permease [Gammaproteobacteria bacterium]|jgi:ABC-2 type transport system permease protein|nr:ABC transporter permease [Gammaproteobacteria bacterium]MBT3725911.1 ABC transporter permease [Gammaproteobacteria bacterium]MBT4076149.1 ABC transporter permease [Gammaproteobacteria bacterium]MBT4195850.1 ABC transporter permease [Gammaproteobacteria bacterium]MBT4448958.1 ABC transporter permease [Gammaproteobacteria bacterium]
MIWTIARREITSMFLSPLAWVILAVIQAILGWMFLAQIENFFILQPQLIELENAPGVTDIIVAPIFSLAAIILLMIMPLLTMRTLAEEKKNKTINLLFSAPISITQLVLGKYVGLLFFVLILTSMLMLMPLSLLVGTDLDLGKLFSIYIGMILLLGSFAAIGLYLSSLTDSQTIAAVSTFGALLMLWIIEWRTEQTLFHYLSLLAHHQPLLEGQFSSVDISYFLLIILLFCGLTIRQLDGDRLQH